MCSLNINKPEYTKSFTSFHTLKINQLQSRKRLRFCETYPNVPIIPAEGLRETVPSPNPAADCSVVPRGKAYPSLAAAGIFRLPSPLAAAAAAGGHPD